MPLGGRFSAPSGIRAGTLGSGRTRRLGKSLPTCRQDCAGWRGSIAPCSTPPSERLVKSPPELWAEVSDPDALARHLGAFGEIRITRLEPEDTVAWEGDRARGTVHLEPSGWGTKVTLTVDADEPEAAEEPEPGAQAPEPVAVEPEPDAGGAEPVAVAEPEPVEEPEAEPVAERTRARARGRRARTRTRTRARARARPGPEGLLRPAVRAVVQRARGARARADAGARRGGTGARARGRRAAEPEPEPVAEDTRAQLDALEARFAEMVASRAPAAELPTPDPGPPPAPSPDPVPPSPTPEPGPPPPPDPSPPQIELDPDQTVARLNAVLDDLGSAHHRPFSRG